MAIKSADQITVLDITDGYTVSLSMDSISLNGGASGLPSAQTVNVVVTALRGTEKQTARARQVRSQWGLFQPQDTT